MPPRGTRETWSMLQARVEALSPPRGSSIIGIKKGEAPLLMSRPPSPSSFAALSEEVENGGCSSRSRGMQMIGIVYRMGITGLSLDLPTIRCKFARCFSTIRSKNALLYSMEIDNEKLIYD